MFNTRNTIVSLLLIILTLNISHISRAQTRVSQIVLPINSSPGTILNPEQICSYNNDLTHQKIIISLPKQREIDEIEKILSFSGLPMNFKIFSANINNAAALVIGEERIILYDPSLLKTVDHTSNTYWTSISILAHEIGHHLSGHTLSSKNNFYQKELEADKFSGFVLYKMGATLNQSTNAISIYGDNSDTRTHPNKEKRIIAINNGWNQAASYRYNGAIPPPPSEQIPVELSLYAPAMFFDKDFANSDYYKEHKKEIEDPSIYAGIILEVTPKYDGDPSGDPATATLIAVQRSVKHGYLEEKGSENTFEPNQKVWIEYGPPIIGSCTMVQYSLFETLMQPGRRIEFSAIWVGGNRVGVYQLNHIRAINNSSSNKQN